MCGCYYIDGDGADEELRQIVEAVNRGNADVKISGEIRPGDVIPVLANSASLRPGAYAMRWGYTLPNGKLVFNVCSETAATKALFRDGMARRRCLVPATCYFEWEERGGEKIKYAIAPRGSAMIYLAGVYCREGNRAACAILTREPAESIAFIHNRMPVILPAGAARDWLNIRYDAAEVLKRAQVDMEYRPA